MPYDIVIGRSESEKQKYGTKGAVFIGKQYISMGRTTSLSNRILLDVATSHVVFICGKRGSGKCLHGDTLITLADGSQVPIKDLENNDGKVLSINDALKIEQSEKTEFFSRKVNTLLKIRLKSGKEIQVTLQHPLLTIKGWKPAQELNLGNRIATPRVMPSFGTKEMAEHEIKLLAYLIAEGHTKSIVLFANADNTIINDFKESLMVLDPTLALIKEKESHYRISSPHWKNKVLDHPSQRNEKGQFLKALKLLLPSFFSLEVRED